MTLDQLSTIKRWHQSHPRAGSVELQVWDLVLTCWLLGWMGLPAAILLGSPLGVLLCVALFYAPGAYVAWRRRLHVSNRLRCDWLDSAR
ncbi:MAG: hypothetical protein L6Q73_01550 [Aquabacterium sp.]|nr:hypothetical protein [Aquabacterium sp.]